VEKPLELELAELVDALCQRWHCPPSEVLRQPVFALQMVALVEMGKPDE
jgi:hypothetical protein